MMKTVATETGIMRILSTVPPVPMVTEVTMGTISIPEVITEVKAGVVLNKAWDIEAEEEKIGKDVMKIPGTMVVITIEGIMVEGITSSMEKIKAGSGIWAA
jgi:hypothetical protein